MIRKANKCEADQNLALLTIRFKVWTAVRPSDFYDNEPKRSYLQLITGSRSPTMIRLTLTMRWTWQEAFLDKVVIGRDRSLSRGCAPLRVSGQHAARRRERRCFWIIEQPLTGPPTIAHNQTVGGMTMCVPASDTILICFV